MADSRVGRVVKWLPAGMLALAAVLRVTDESLFLQPQNWIFDSYQRARPRPYEDASVRLIDIDDESLSRLGQWPWPRTMVARVIDRLRELGATVTALDVMFPEADRTSPRQIVPLWPRGPGWPSLMEKARRLPDHDELLARSIARSRVVLGMTLTPEPGGRPPLPKCSFSFAGDDPVRFLDRFSGSVTNLPPLEQAAAGNGSFNNFSDVDDVNRRVPLVLRLGDRLVPSLMAEALRVASGQDTIRVKSSGGSGETAFGAHTGIVKMKIGPWVIPTDSQGRLWMYYSQSDPRRTIPVWKIFEPGFDPGLIKGSIAILGTSAAGLKDQRATPLNPLAPGMEIHAQAAEQIILGKFLQRPDWAPGAEVVYLLVFGVAVILLLERLGALWGALLAGGAVLFPFLFSWFAFSRWQWLVDPLFPATAVLLIYLASSLIGYLQSESERRQVRGAFSRYMSPVLVEELARHPEKLKLGGEMRSMTFHFCDIESFTTMSEWYDPAGLTKFLNRFLTPMTDIILKHRGSIDKYVGDCIVAYWNAPLDDPDHAKNACLATIEMSERLESLNAELRREAESAGRKFSPLRVRTGLNTGSCIVGNMGSDQRFDYSVLGDDVNLASRLEGANKFFGTYAMIGESTYRAAAGAVEARELGRIKVVGKSTAIRVYNLLARKGELPSPWRQALPDFHQGLAHFEKKEFAEAQACFERVLRVMPQDGPTKVYLSLCADYAVIPPPDDWDGSFNLTAK